MQVKDKVNKLIVKLLRDTLTGKVKWTAGAAPRALLEATDDRIPLYLYTELGSRGIAVYQRRWQDVDDERGIPSWHERPGLCIFEGERNKPVWEYDRYSPALRDLIRTARDQAAGADELLDELIAASP